MPTDWLELPKTGAFALVNGRAPAALVESPQAVAVSDGLVACDLVIANGAIYSVHLPGLAPDMPRVDLDHGLIFPGLVDIHTHLDKGHIWPRAPNPDGTFASALATTALDRTARWDATDVAARMDFALRCAFAHGTVAVRTHLDSMGPQTAITWPVFAAMRERWSGRIDLQAVPLFPIELAADEDAMREIVAAVRWAGSGLLGAVADMKPELATGLERLFRIAGEEGWALDFHVDETLDPAANALRVIAETAIKMRFRGRVLCGHCCALAQQPREEADRTLDLVARAGLAVVSLPLCNLYLQDRTPGRTPRARGVTTLHELAARGVPVLLGSDNTRDPFYPYGDLDMLEVLREGVRIGHLDRPVDTWPRAIGAEAADHMGLPHRGRIGVGAAADLVLVRARSWSELLARPQADRAVLRAGRLIDTTLPDYRELDRFMEPAP